MSQIERTQKKMNQGMTNNGRLLLRGGEVAELLGISRALAYQWMAQRVIPVVSIPGSRSIRVPREALMGWIEAQTERPGELRPVA
jgi:excisionase family DNA binding protein